MKMSYCFIALENLDDNVNLCKSWEVLQTISDCSLRESRSMVSTLGALGVS
jgi:hypothetical protein